MKRYAFFCLAIMLIVGITGCEQEDNSAVDAPTWQEQYDLGIRYLSEGNYEEAIIAFTAAIEIDPYYTDSYLKLADIYASLNDYENAKIILYLLRK